jgi:hypothetical protein
MSGCPTAEASADSIGSKSCQPFESSVIGGGDPSTGKVVPRHAASATSVTTASARAAVR